MVSNMLIIISISLIVYLLLGFSLISDRNFIHPRTASLFNRMKKNIYASDLNEKLKKNVISRDQYEWIKSDRYSTPIGEHNPQ